MRKTNKQLQEENEKLLAQTENNAQEIIYYQRTNKQITDDNTFLKNLQQDTVNEMKRVKDENSKLVQAIVKLAGKI